MTFNIDIENTGFLFKVQSKCNRHRYCCYYWAPRPRLRSSSSLNRCLEGNKGVIMDTSDNSRMLGAILNGTDQTTMRVCRNFNLIQSNVMLIDSPAQCGNYLCPGTLSCVHFPHHCPCAFPDQEEKVELGDGSMVCASKGGFVANEFARKVELARKGLL
jgi:hypothetical protein